MLSFRHYLRESPNEIDHRVPVSFYFSQPYQTLPIEAFPLGQPNGPGGVPRDVDIASLIPTQQFVNNLKIYTHYTGADFEEPVIYPYAGQLWVIDGHHRICRRIVRGYRYMRINLM